jgi:hypothetical protein
MNGRSFLAFGRAASRAQAYTGAPTARFALVLSSAARRRRRSIVVAADILIFLRGLHESGRLPDNDLNDDEAVFDELARRAGAALRRPAPQTGCA